LIDAERRHGTVICLSVCPKLSIIDMHGNAWRVARVGFPGVHAWHPSQLNCVIHPSISLTIERGLYSADSHGQCVPAYTHARTHARSDRLAFSHHTHRETERETLTHSCVCAGPACPASCVASSLLMHLLASNSLHCGVHGAIALKAKRRSLTPSVTGPLSDTAR